MAETLRSRPSADMRDAGREVKKQGDGRDLIPVIVSHVVSPDQMYVQHASSAARKNLQRFTAFCLEYGCVSVLSQYSGQLFSLVNTKQALWHTVFLECTLYLAALEFCHHFLGQSKS